MPESAPPHRRWLSWRTVLVVGLCAMGAAYAGEVAYILLGSNLREVVPGQLYRSAQPDLALLAEAQQRYGVRSVLSLRGLCESEAWCRDEIAAAEELGLSVEVVGLSASRLPSAQATRALCDILERSEPPLLVHCQRGIDRTGLLCALYLLLRTETTLDQARGQLSLRYLHLSIGKTQAMDSFLDLYADWLAERGATHTPALLRRWLQVEYRPPQGLAQIELRAPTSGRVQGDRQKTTAIPVRVWNRSREPLPLSPTLHGMYLRWTLTKPDRTPVIEAQPGGLRRVTIAPDEAADLTVYLPGLPCGRFLLKIELHDEKLGSFCQFGSDALVVEVHVP